MSTQSRAVAGLIRRCGTPERCRQVRMTFIATALSLQSTYHQRYLVLEIPVQPEFQQEED